MIYISQPEVKLHNYMQSPTFYSSFEDQSLIASADSEEAGVCPPPSEIGQSRGLMW